MNRAAALAVLAVMALAVIANVALHGPNWVALVFIVIAGAAVVFGFNEPRQSDVD